MVLLENNNSVGIAINSYDLVYGTNDGEQAMIELLNDDEDVNRPATAVKGSGVVIIHTNDYFNKLFNSTTLLLYKTYITYFGKATQLNCHSKDCPNVVSQQTMN